MVLVNFKNLFLEYLVEVVFLLIQLLTLSFLILSLSSSIKYKVIIG